MYKCNWFIAYYLQVTLHFEPSLWQDLKLQGIPWKAIAPLAYPWHAYLHLYKLWMCVLVDSASGKQLVDILAAMGLDAVLQFSGTQGGNEG